MGSKYGFISTFSTINEDIDYLVVENLVEQHTKPSTTPGSFLRSNSFLMPITNRELRVRNGGEKLPGSTYQQQERFFGNILKQNQMKKKCCKTTCLWSGHRTFSFPAKGTSGKYT